MLHGQMLHGQMLHGQTGKMFPRKLTTHTDGLIIEFGSNGIGIFKLGQMLHGKMLMVQMSSYRWPNHSTFKVLTNNS